MFRTQLILLVIIFLVGCKQNEQPREVKYSYACLDSTISGSDVNKALEKAGDIIRDLSVDEEQITDQVQNQYGASFHNDAIETKTFVLLKNAKINANLNSVLKDLLAARTEKTDIEYKIYALDDSVINAFTFGGRIYVTKAMYNKCNGKTPLLYAIVGHEIGHSEKGHIKRTIQDMMLANKVFGEQNGTMAFQVIRMLTGSFNQKNELEADYYGTDLTYRLNQDLCAAVTFWEEMSEQENQYNRLEDFFCSHPFSSLRASCLRSHIFNNFNKSCDTPESSNKNQ